MAMKSALTLIISAICTLAALASGAPSPTNTSEQNELIKIAKAAVRAEVTGKGAPVLLKKSDPKPVFVTIESKGSVIGCRGELETRSDSLQQEVVLASRAAARHDPRYPPLNEKSLQDFQVTITIVQRLDPITSVDGLQPSDGLVLRAGTKIGVVLPWEGKDPQTRMQWAYKKAGVQPGSACQLQRMNAERFRG